MASFLAVIFSLVPGVGHWMLGRRKKALVLFAVDGGILYSVFFLRSTTGYLLAFMGYLMTMIPAAFEAFTLARGGVSRLNESKLYILAMLFVGGFAALPLLWQSRAFSRPVKIAWSGVVFTLAVFYFSFLGAYGLQLFNHV